VDREALRKHLRRVARKVDLPARDAGIEVGADGFVITPERVGRVVDVEATEKNIVRYFAPLCHREIALVMREDRPR
jgi:vancomycin resistance protein YoaR